MLKVIVVSIIVTGLVAFWLFNNKKMKTYNHYMKRKKMLEEAIKDFTSTEKYVNQNMAIAVNTHDKKLCISVMKEGTPVTFICNSDNIKGCEILENGLPISTTVIETNKINRIDLKISLENSENPHILANFLFWDSTRDSEEYKVLYKDTMHWHEIINSFIKK